MSWGRRSPGRVRKRMRMCSLCIQKMFSAQNVFSIFRMCLYMQNVFSTCRTCSLHVWNGMYSLPVFSIYVCVLYICVCIVCVMLSCSHIDSILSQVREQPPQSRRAYTHTQTRAHTHTHTTHTHTHTHTREARAMRSDLFRRDRFCVFWRLLVIVPYQTQCQYQ